ISFSPTSSTISWYRSARYSALKQADVPQKKPRTPLSGLSANRVMPISCSAHAAASSLLAHSSPQLSPSSSMYGISSAWYASHSRSSHLSRVLASAGASTMMGTSWAIALLTAVPIAPDELSTFSRAGEIRSSSSTPPPAANNGSRRAVFLISLTACLIRTMAGCDRHPNAWRRKRAWNSHLWLAGTTFTLRRLNGHGLIAEDLLRIPVATVVSMAAQGQTHEQIVAELPELELEDIREALR